MKQGTYKRSEETLKRMRESHIGNAGWNKGVPRSEECKEKIRQALKGNKPWNTGKHRSKATKQKLREANRGRVSPNKGKKGKPAWNKGLTKETDNRVAINGINVGKALKGSLLSVETRLKLRESHKGEKHWNWRGGISGMYKLHRAERNWKKRSRKTFERDNFQCQLCGRKSGKLHAHHIIPWRVEHNDKLNNLITLCNSCHSKVERKWYQYAPMFFEILGIYVSNKKETLFQ